MALTLPYPTYSAFAPGTVHSDSAHNIPHAGLLTNDIAIKSFVDGLETSIGNLSATDIASNAVWNDHLFSTVKGYQKFPGGLIMQWAYGTPMNTETSQVISWAVQYPSGIFTVQISTMGSVSNAYTDAWFRLANYNVVNVTTFLQATGSGLGGGYTYWPLVLSFGY